MSIKEYVYSLTSPQLEHLIEVATQRRIETKSAGYVRLFGVFGGKKGALWFTDRDSASLAFFATAQEVMKDSRPEVSIEPRNVQVCDLVEYIGLNESLKLIQDGKLIKKDEF